LFYVSKLGCTKKISSEKKFFLLHGLIVNEVLVVLPIIARRLNSFDSYGRRLRACASFAVVLLNVAHLKLEM